MMIIVIIVMMTEFPLNRNKTEKRLFIKRINGVNPDRGSVPKYQRRAADGIINSIQRRRLES